jgi:phosphoribosylformylglycinamidine (FGAM) synthase PurS component
MFGRGQREELDDDEGRELARQLRSELAKEVRRVKVEEGIDLDIDREANEADMRRMERL